MPDENGSTATEPEPTWHGPELDLAMEGANTRLPHMLGLCDTALGSRKEPIIEQTMEEGASPEKAEEIRKELIAAGAPFDGETVQLVQIRTAIGGALSYGISTGILLEREALARKLLSPEVIDAVAERLWNEREFRDPSGPAPDDWIAPGDNPDATPPHEPHLWADVVKEDRYQGDVREYRADAQHALESVVERLDKPIDRGETVELGPDDAELMRKLAPAKPEPIL